MGCAVSQSRHSYLKTESSLLRRQRRLEKRSKLEIALDQIVNGATNVEVIRDFVDDQGVQSLCMALHKNTTVNELNLSCNRISFGGCDAIVRLLESNSYLVNLNIASNRIGQLGVFAVSCALRLNCSIKFLDLSDNNVDDSGFCDLAEAIKCNQTLQTLILAGHHATDQGVFRLTSALQHNETLQELDLHGHGDHVLSLGKIGEDGAMAFGALLKLNVGLRRLNLGGNQIGDAGVLELFRAIAVYDDSKLESISLDRNQLTRKSAGYIADCLSVSDKLIFLDLTGNRIGDFGVGELARSLRKNQSLKSLVLRENGITQAGIVDLANYLSRNKTLASLNLAGNEILDAGIQPLARYLESDAARNLVELDLSSCGIRAPGARELALSLKHNDSLRVLHLGFNEIDDDFVGQIASMLEINETLLSLDLRNHSISMYGASNLIYALRLNKSLTKLIMSPVMRSLGVHTPNEIIRQSPEIHALLARNFGLRIDKLRRVLRAAFRLIIFYSRFRKEYYIPEHKGALLARQDFQKCLAQCSNMKISLV